MRYLKKINHLIRGFWFLRIILQVRLFLKLESLFRSKNENWKSTTYYKKDDSNIFSQLCDLFGSDKGGSNTLPKPYPWPSHSYDDYYWRIFENCRSSIKKVLEVGIGTNNPNLASSMGINGKPGASLRVWREFFPNALIYGADIDREILFKEERIETGYMDQLNPESISDFFKNFGQEDFDFICDDGLHTFEAGSNLFINAIDKLRFGGVYIIEDVSVPDLYKYKVFFDRFLYNVEYVTLYRPGLDLQDNNLVVVKK